MKFETNGQKNSILLGVIVCVLIMGIGVSFAYFTTGMKIENNPGEGLKVTTAAFLKTTYDAGTSAIKIDNAYPGMKDITKNFSVKVTPSITQNETIYDIFLNIESNNFEVCKSKTPTNNCVIDASEFTYKLTAKNKGVPVLLYSGDLVNGKEEITGDLTDGANTILSTPIKLATVKHSALDGETTYEFTLTFSFKDTKSDQNHNENKTFKGSVDVQLYKE